MSALAREALIDPSINSNNLDDPEAQQVHDENIEVEQRRNQRLDSRFTDSQWQLIKYVLPVQFLASIFIVVNASILFSQESKIVRKHDNALYLAGSCIQGYFLIIVLRDLVIFINYFVRKERDATIMVLLTHYCTACIDICFLIFLFLWALVVLYSSPIDQVFPASSVSVPNDAVRFFKVTELNAYFAFIYIVTHFCILPLALWCVLRSPYLTRRLQLVQNWHEDGTEEFGPTGEAIQSTIRMQQARVALEYLKPCTITELQAQHRIAKTENQELICVICTVEQEPTDVVVQLECNSTHVFHEECLLPWLEKSLTCPTCRTPVDIY